MRATDCDGEEIEVGDFLYSPADPDDYRQYAVTKILGLKQVTVSLAETGFEFPVNTHHWKLKSSPDIRFAKWCRVYEQGLRE